MCIVRVPALQTIAGREWNDTQTLLAKGGHSWSYRLVLGLVFGWMGFPEDNNVFYLLICFDRERLVTSARRMNGQAKCC